MLKLQVFGQLNKVAFEKASLCAKDLHEAHPDKFEKPDIHWFFEFDWAQFIDKKKRELRGFFWNYNAPVLVMINNEVIGTEENFRDWATTEYNCVEYRPTILYSTMAMENYAKEIYRRDRTYIKMDVSIDGDSCGNLLIELYTDLLPKTCENFRSLCAGLGCVDKNEYQQYQMQYAGTKFFRLVKNGWIQGGDVMHSRGNEGRSIYGPTFEDESFEVKHDRRGIVSMANSGHHTNGSQFFITLAPTPWMDEVYVAFGRVIEGSSTLERMENVPTENERPIKDICIEACEVIYSGEIFDRFAKNKPGA